MNYSTHDITALILAMSNGLSRFMRRPMRVALVYTLNRMNEPLRIIDPFVLMPGHKDHLTNEFLSSDGWKSGEPLGVTSIPTITEDLVPAPGLPQAHFSWYADRGITSARTAVRIWFELATAAIAGLVRGEAKPVNLSFQLRGLEEAALDVVAALADSHQGDLRKETTVTVLRELLAISVTTEESKRALGRLLITDQAHRVKFMSKLKTSVPLNEHRWVRKLLTTVETEPLCLICDGKDIIGFAEKQTNGLLADFAGHGHFISVNQPIAEMRHGQLYAAADDIDFKAISGALFRVCNQNEARALACSKALSTIVKQCIRKAHGFSIAITNDDPRGQYLSAALSVGGKDELIVNMSAVDGSILMRGDGTVAAFGCLLDGLTSDKEEPGRGSRFNSAVRYTESEAHRGTSIVLVGSEDGGVDAVFEGRNLIKVAPLPRVDARSINALELTEWINQIDAMS